MAPDPCAAMRLLMQADHDGELDVAASAQLAAHLAGCPDCRARQAALASLSAGLRTLPRHAAPDALRAAVAAALPRPARRRRFAVRLPTLVPFGLGAALAAAVLLVVLPPPGPDMAASIVDSHVRALQPGHLMDVVSTDQHTVKPWFDGRLDFAPPVRDFATEGFPLAGGRLDYLAGRPVAALAYLRAKHVIDVYVWPGTATDAAGARAGYNFRRWSGGGMVFWAVSDLNADELGRFVALWRAAP